MIWCIIIIVISIAMMIAGEMLIVDTIGTKDEVSDAYIGVLILGLSLIALCLSAEFWAFHLNEPTPLDVYRGNTTLEIRSIDGVPTDSVVVFKKK